MAETSQKTSSNYSLTNILLNRSNYLLWARAVTIALGGLSKEGHITSISKSDETYEKKKAEWRASGQYVMSWLFNSMDPNIYEIFAYSNSAQELWDSLYKMYGFANNSSRIFEIQELFSLKQSSDQSFIEHLGKVKKYWEKLRQYRPTAATVSEYVKREEQDRIFHLLASLSSDYEETRREILMCPESPSLNIICSIIQSEETRKRVMGRNSKVTQFNSQEH
jgi:gag-polypeptide of LTR copia-type